MRPAPLHLPERRQLIRAGNLDDDLARVRDVDWVIEAVVEDLAIKRDLWARAAPAAGPAALLTTNTSGLSIEAIATALAPAARERFLGSHFFNPPRYLHLVELVPTATTAAASLALARLWLERDLGKGVVVARDTPGFIANRLGAYALAATLRAIDAFELTPEEADALTGTVIGHPRSATLGSLDMVGLDTALRVADHLAATVADTAEREALALPAYVREMAARGLLGTKSGGGFFRRGGGGPALVFERATFTYRPARPVAIASLERVRRIDDLGERLRALCQGRGPRLALRLERCSRRRSFRARVADEVAGGDLGRHRPGHALGLRLAARAVRDVARRSACERPPSGCGPRARRLGRSSRRPSRAVPRACTRRRRRRRRRQRPHGGRTRRGGATAAPGSAHGGPPPLWRGESATFEDAGQEVACLVLHPRQGRHRSGPDRRPAPGLPPGREGRLARPGASSPRDPNASSSAPTSGSCSRRPAAATWRPSTTRCAACRPCTRS